VENEDVVQAITSYLESFNKDIFEEGCRQFLEKVEKEIAEYHNALHKFCDAPQPSDFYA